MNFFERFNEWIRRSLILKLLGVGILVLLLLIPTQMVQSLIQEREYTSQAVIDEVSSLWSNPQRISGPIISVPYKEYYKNDKGELLSNTLYAYFLPESLKVDGTLESQTRYRSIYEVVVYNTDLKVSGNFKRPDFSDWKIEESNILWDEAALSIGISDMRGIQNTVQLSWNDTTLAFEPGIRHAQRTNNQDNYNAASSNSGISTSINLSEVVEAYDFQFDTDLNGSQNIYFTPLGRATNVALQSDWLTPSFKGSFLPDERSVSNEGFTANWEVLNLNRNYPQKWRNQSYNFFQSQFGVDLLIPVDYYQKSMRSAKYAILFIALTFLIFFFVEVLNNKRIHPIQYILVGLALVLFFSLLLALSEHIGFSWSYLTSSIIIIALIAVYISSVFKNRNLTFVTTGILGILYGFIYTLLQLEDYALLLGTIGLLIILSIIMFFTRRIDWYNLYDRPLEE